MLFLFLIVSLLCGKLSCLVLCVFDLAFSLALNVFRIQPVTGCCCGVWCVVLDGGRPSPAQVVLLLLVFFMRKRVALTIALFHVAGKVFIHLPLLAVQPLWTFLALMCFWVYWVMVLLFLGTAGEEMATEQGLKLTAGLSGGPSMTSP